MWVRQNSCRDAICSMDMLVLCGRVVSSCSLCLTICMAGCTGTDVNRAFTSKEVDDFPWFQLFSLELLDKMLGVFKVVVGVAYKGFDNVC